MVNPLTATTVDKVLRNFQKAMTQLDEVARYNLEIAEQQERRMQEALEASRAAQSERARALKVRDNMEKLLGL